MAFKYAGTLAPNMGRMIVGGDGLTRTSPVTIIANSEVVQIGDALEWDADGFLIAKNTAASAVAGILVSVAKAGDISVDPDAGTLDTWTVDSDNETVDKYYALMDISPYSLYSVGADATLGTTTGSNLAGYFFDTPTNDETQLDESTSSATTGNFFSLGVDPEDSTRVIVKINELSGFASSV